MSKSIKINDTLEVSSNFFNFIVSYENKISNLILNYTTIESINYIDIFDNQMISFISNSKLKKNYIIDDYYDNNHRSIMKIGRIVSKLIPKNVMNSYVSNSDVENFVNLYKSHFDNISKELLLVEGNDIKKYYNEENYYELDLSNNTFVRNGTLWKSCLRYDHRMNHLDLFVNNDFKLLVLLHNNKVLGRSLIYNAIDKYDNSEIFIMDRIYTFFDSDVNIFKRYAIDNNMIFKYEQTSRIYDEFSNTMNNESLIFKQIYKKLSYYEFDKYPYMDTLKYLNSDEGVLYNFESDNVDKMMCSAEGILYDM